MEKMKRASLKGILLLVLMLFMLMPLYAFAEGEPYSVRVDGEGVSEIGTYGGSTVYYLTVPEGTTSVSFDDIVDDDLEYATIIPASGEYSDMISETRVAPVSDAWRIGESEAAQNITLNDGVEQPDYSNAYLYYVYPIDDENVAFVVNMPAEEEIPDITFEATANGKPLTVKSTTEDGYTYHDYYAGEHTVDLVTVEIPFGTTTVDLAFSENALAYNYTLDGVKYLDGYYDDYQVGAATASVKVNANITASGDPEQPDYYIPADTAFDAIQVQTPYKGTSSHILYAITFAYPESTDVWASLSEIKNGTPAALPENFTWKQYPELIKPGETAVGKASYTDPAVGVPVEDLDVNVKGQPSFEVSAGGVAFEKITCEEKAFDYTPYGGTPYKVDIYTVEVPYTTEKVDLKFTNNILAYNYAKDGTYLKGWYEGDSYMTGGTEATVDVNANAEPIVSEYGTIPADNEPDYVYIQDPYDADWNTALHYIVTFKRVADTKQPMSVKAKKAYTVKAKTLKKKTVKLSYKKVMTIKNAKGKLTFKKLSGKKIKISSTGKITVPKKLKKGKYTIKVKVTAAGKDQYKSGYKTVKFTIKVK